MEPLFFLAMGSPAGRLPHRRVSASSIDLGDKEVCVICQSGTFHRHKIHPKMRDGEGSSLETTEGFDSRSPFQVFWKNTFKIVVL